MLDTPVLFLVFNRPDTTKQVFEAIRRAKPARLFVAADGPRPHHAADAERCSQVRNIITEIDWHCEVKTLFRDNNLGCGRAVSSAITWFFEQVEEGIILEDDTLPDPSFFSFCTHLLGKYRENDEVFYVSGTSLIKGAQELCPESYYFGRYGSIWGWASWRRAWSKYEYDLAGKNTRLEVLVSDMSNRRSERSMLLNIFKSISEGRIDTWDYQFLFAISLHNGLAAIPTRNLVRNIGFGENATHTFADAPALATETEALQSVVHPGSIVRNELLDKIFLEKYCS